MRKQILYKMKKCPNCGSKSVKKPPMSKKPDNSSKITTIIGKKPQIGGKKTTL